MTYRISAVIPAYNAAQFLPETIASIRAQTIPVDEIIIVDDGSIDNTAQTVTALGRDIIYSRQDNAGPSAARNRGIEIATGNLIAFLDADDKWVPSKTGDQLRVLNKYPNLGLICGDMAETDANGNVTIQSILAKHHMLSMFEKLESKPIPNGLTAVVNKNFIPTGTVLARKEALTRAGLFRRDIRYGEDLDLWAKIAKNWPLSCIPKVMMYRRKHGQNLTSHGEALLRDLVKVSESIRVNCANELRQQHQDPDDLVAKSLADLAYYLFDKGEYDEARKYFSMSLDEHINKRALFYRFALCLPPALIGKIRDTKQKYG